MMTKIFAYMAFIPLIPALIFFAIGAIYGIRGDNPNQFAACATLFTLCACILAALSAMAGL